MDYSNVVGIHFFGGDIVKFEVGIDEREYDVIYDRYRKSGHVDRPLYSQSLGYRKVVCSFNFDIHKIFTSNIPLLRLVRINKTDSDSDWKSIKKWIKTLTNITHFISSKVLSNKLLERIITKNPITVLRLIIDSTLSYELCKYDLSSVSLTLGWSNKKTPENMK